MFSKNTLFICGVSAFAIASPVFAQNKAADAASETPSVAQDTAAGEIIVTANKREQNLSKVGSTISALSAADLATRRVANVADLAQATPGLVFAPSPDATPVYTLRGIGFFENSLAAYPDVSLYIDQAPLSLPAMAALTVFDLERVEVLKGPQGTLFGNNATGGAINFIAAKPTRDFQAGMELGYGRFNTVDVSGFVSGPITDTLRARLAVKAVKGDDWQKSQTRDDTLGKQNNVAARLLLDWEPTENLKFSANLNGWKNRDDPVAPQNIRIIPQNDPALTPDIPVYHSPLAPNKARVADWGGQRPYQNDRFKQATLRGDYDFGGVTLTSLTGYSDLKKLGAFENDGTAFYDGGDSVRIDGHVKSFTQELRLANESSANFRWVVGGNYERTTVDQQTFIDFRDTITAATLRIARTAPNSRSAMRNYAVFANGEFDLTDRLTLKAGIRRTRAARDFTVSNNDTPDFQSLSVQGPIASVSTQNLNTLFSFFSDVFRGGAGLPPVAGVPQTGPIASPCDGTFATFCDPTPSIASNGSIIFLDTAVNPDGTPVNPATYFTAGVLNTRLVEHNTSWSVGLDFKPTSTLLIYVNAAKGYKAGGFPHLSGSTYVAYDPVKQESLLDIEGGFKAQLMDHKLSINGAVFYYDYKNKQLKGKFVDRIFGGLDRLSNVPKSRLKGAELDIQARPFEGLSISASATYLDAKVREYIGTVSSVQDPATQLYTPILASFKGVRLPFSPKFQYALRVDYDFPVADELNAFVGGGVNGQTESIGVLLVNNPNPPFNLAPRDTFKLNAHALVSLNAGIRAANNRWRFTLWGKNVFNKFYATNIVAAYDTVARYPGRPAEYGASIAVKF